MEKRIFDSIESKNLPTKKIIMFRITNWAAIVFLLLVFACNSSKKAVVNQSLIQNNTTTKKVFLFAGQSNMEGRADADKIPLEDVERLEAVKHRIQFYYNSEPVSPLKVTTGSTYVQKKFSLTNVFGPELFFGIELAEAYPNEEFIFIKRSKGGTSLYGAWNPNWTEEKAALTNELKIPKLYSEFISLSRSVLDSMPKNAYEICGMLWVQGEADTNTKRGLQPSESYGDNLTTLIHSVREEFELPEMPFLLFQVGGGKVVEGMLKVAENDTYVGMIPQSSDKKSKDYYPKNPSPLGHYVTNSMKRIGTEFFSLYQELYVNEYLTK